MPTMRAIGGKGSHDTLLRVLATRTPGRILDVPAGQGVIGAFLKDKGWDVHAADIDPGLFKLQDVPFTRVNLNQDIPFEDATFDAVACVNGLQRVIFPEVAIAEFFRILKPGGRLYINVNNYSCIWKRLRFLFSGSIDKTLDTQYCFQTIADREANVRLPLMYTRLATILEEMKFQVVDVQPAAMSVRDRLLSPLALLISGAGLLIPSAQRKAIRLNDGNHWSVLAGGQYVFIEAVKPAV